MAEYAEVNKQFRRMCSIYQSKRCSGCPMECVNISQCRKKAFEWPREFETTVMQWAKENPEKIYPAWRDVLIDIGFTKRTITDMGICTKYSWGEPIPADIAEKLGIKPINREHT